MSNTHPGGAGNATGGPSRWTRLVEDLSYRMRLALLTLFGPATQDAEHDPIVALKRRYGRPLPAWSRAKQRTQLTREQVIIDIRETPEDDLGRLWPQVQQEWGVEASRIWQEALSAKDASDT